MPTPKNRPYWRKRNRSGTIAAVVHDPEVYEYLSPKGAVLATVTRQGGSWVGKINVPGRYAETGCTADLGSATCKKMVAQLVKENLRG